MNSLRETNSLFKKKKKKWRPLINTDIRDMKGVNQRGNQDVEKNFEGAGESQEEAGIFGIVSRRKAFRMCHVVTNWRPSTSVKKVL